MCVEVSSSSEVDGGVAGWMDVVVGVDGEVDEEGCGSVDSGGSLLSWKLLVVFSQSFSMSALTAVRWNMGSQSSLSALAMAVGVVASSSSSEVDGGVAG